MKTKEHERLSLHHQRLANWKEWGPYLSERAWGTVREDYSSDGEAWHSFTHDQARSRAYRWNEDGLSGISDRSQYLCFAPAFWNGVDPILKERYFGLSNFEGNHGEDLKECYYYLDSTPTHSYMKMLYKYPQKPFPYHQLVEENRKRSLQDLEYELLDTGIFADRRYFDIFIEYAKADQKDILIKITAHNRSSEASPLFLIPTLWFRNTWSWGYPHGPMNDVQTKPYMKKMESSHSDIAIIQATHPTAGAYTLYAEKTETLLFTENETNRERLLGQPNVSPYVKDGFHRYLIQHETHAVNPNNIGTKAAAVYETTIPGGQSHTIRLRLSADAIKSPFDQFESIFQTRKEEADEFYRALQNPKTTPEENLIQRQALAGMLWTKQLYYFDLEQWLKGDPEQPNVRKMTPKRNEEWNHLVNFDILSMPDKWEFPWYASWDLAFHCVALVLVDPDFAKRQLTLMTREWYMHPNGQIPAYEWNFSDASPPVIAWAAWRVYKIDAHMNGTLDKEFLISIFNKLLMNFTWWVNRKDIAGRNVFQGGFLGLDNISLFNRSEPLPDGGHIYQSDATAWMAFYCIIMIKISIELARDLPVYEDMATKFFEHFLRISEAMVKCGGQNHSLWNPTDGFFYDVIVMPDGTVTPLKVRSLVGLLPLFAVETASKEFMDDHPLFQARVEWFLTHHPRFKENMAPLEENHGPKRLLAILTKERLLSVLRYMLDENEFLSEYGIRSISKVHQKNPYQLYISGKLYTIGYEPGTAQTHLFGGNSNWRGPVWFPLNFLIIESLQKFYYYYGDSLKVECPTGSGRWMNLWEVATEISQRLISLFLPNSKGQRPAHGSDLIYAEDPHWKDLILFYEYFHGDRGKGLGASHQTGWTGLVAKLIQQTGRPSVRQWREISKKFKTKL